MMSGKRRTQQMTATYCRAYLVTVGTLLAGGSGAVAVLTGASISVPGLALALLICVLAVVMLAMGLFGPVRQMEAWADAASGHEVALVLMGLAYPVYLLMAPFYARR